MVVGKIENMNNSPDNIIDNDNILNNELDKQNDNTLNNKSDKQSNDDNLNNHHLNDDNLNDDNFNDDNDDNLNDDNDDNDDNLNDHNLNDDNIDYLNNDNLNDDNVDYLNDEKEVNIEFYKNKVAQDKLRYEKTLFIKHLEKKINGIEKRMRYINHKYVDYYNYYNRLNGIVITLSACLTLFEASTNIIDYDEIEISFLKVIFQMLPLLTSTLISLIATYIKFKKYQENMERLIVTEEKGIIAISKLKKIREIVYFNDNRLDEIKNTYLEETYQFYNEVNVKISIELDENDYKKYYKRMSDVDVNIGKTYLRKSKNINNIIDKHIDMENKYEHSDEDDDKDDNDVFEHKRMMKPKPKGSMFSCSSS